jgi:alpha-1,6-mannosyltransferase
MQRRSPILAGIALGAGVLVKYFPIATGPALYRRWDWRLPIAFAATVVLLYLPYIGAGTQVFGFLGKYVAEEGLDGGSGIFLWQLVGAIVPLRDEAFSFYFPAAATVMAGLALFVVMRERRPAADLAGAMLLAVTFTILFSPHYPWYFVWLVPFLCFYPVVGVVYLTCASSYLYSAHWPPTLSDGLVIYGPCVLILIAELVLRGRRKLEDRHGNAIAA